MQTSFFSTLASPGYLLLFALIAGIITWWLYRKPGGSYPSWRRWLLAGLRFLVLFLLLTLFLTPFIRYISRETESPSLLFLIDNSTSMKADVDSVSLNSLLERLDEMGEQLSSEGYQVYFSDLSSATPPSTARDIQFEAPASDLRSAITNAEERFEGRNLSGVILLSDGIYNSGASPVFTRYPFPIYTIGTGDTSTRRDISLKALHFNKIAYQGNKFPIQAEVLADGFKGVSVNVSITHKGKVIDSKNVIFNQDRELQNVDFLIEATEKGNQRYQIRVSPVQGEHSTTNNTRNAILEIVEGKEKILVAALRPHPDIKAIVESIEENSNYETEIYLPYLNEKPPTNGPYDLIILHQLLPEHASLRNIPGLANSAKWILYGQGMDMNALIRLELINARPIPGEFDQVNAYINTAFGSFTLPENMGSSMREWPPLMVPYGDFSPAQGVEALLYQQVGPVKTNKPLFVFRDSEPRMALLLGEGLWRWKLDDYLQNESHEAFDGLISRAVQYLSTKNDTRKLRIFPLDSDQTMESIIIETETYNELFERIYGVPVKLEVTDEDGKVSSFEYALGEGNSRYRLTGLHPGIYTYKAVATLGNGTASANGQFVINDIDIEKQTEKADFNLLKTLAEENNGIFVTQENMGSLTSRLKENRPPDLLISFDSLVPLMDLWPFLLLLVFAIASEWVLRKYWSGM